MQIRLKESKSQIWDCPSSLVKPLLKKFSYTNRNVSYSLSKHIKGSFRYIQKEKAKGFTEKEAWANYNREKKRLQEEARVCLLKEIDGRVIEYPTGLTKKIIAFLRKQDKTFDAQSTVVDVREKPDETYGYTIRGKLPNLYPYQVEMVKKMIEAGQGTIVSGTGTGKTVVIQEILRELGLKAVIIVPTLSIMNQTVKRFQQYFGRERIGVYGGGKKQIKKITLACAPSIADSDPKEWEDVDVVIADECHHVPCNTVEKIFYEVIPNAYYRFGFTATNYRTDGADLAIEAAVFPPVYEYDLKRGIEEGYLAKPTFVMFQVPFSASNYSGNHPTFVYKNHILKNHQFNEKVKEQIQKIVAAGDRTLVLVREKSHGHYFQEHILGSVFVRNKESSADKKKLKYIAPYVNPDDAVQDFNNKKINCLIGTSIIGEGTDIVPVDTVVLLTGGSSKVTVMQNIGRGLRQHPDKDGVTIIDYFFTNNDMLEKHSMARFKYYKEITGEVHVFDL